MTVRGVIATTDAGITDAHNHLWITPVMGAHLGLPVLVDRTEIANELGDYLRVGGCTIVDCQPGGCGRDGRVLRELSLVSGGRVRGGTPEQILPS